MTAGRAFTASSQHPLMADFWGQWTTPEFVWQIEAEIIANRAEALACNDPFIAAMIAAEIQGILGPNGLRLSSQYDTDPTLPETSDADQAARRGINAIIGATWRGRQLDADGLRTRREIEWALRWWALVRGDGFAVRVMRKGRSAWQMIHPRRVRNPTIATLNTAFLRDGFALDAQGAVTGIWISPPTLMFGGPMPDAKPIFVPWYADDGTPNILHAVGYRLPGMMRGVSVIAPIVLMARQVQAVLESHVAGKRVQAIHPLIVEAEDPEAYKAAIANGCALDPMTFAIDSPLQLFVKAPGSTVDFPDTKFDGKDLDDYVRSMYRTQAATRGMPVEVVLCQMGEASLASARAGLDQFDRSMQTCQEGHIAEIAGPMDQVAIADAIAYGEIDLGADPGSAALTVGTYSRPPKYSTDRLKDANTILALLDGGMSGTTAFAMFGASWEDEQEQRRAEAKFLVAQDIPPLAPANAPGVTIGAEPSPADGSTPSTDTATPNGDQTPAGEPPKKPGAFHRLLSRFRRSAA